MLGFENTLNTFYETLQEHFLQCRKINLFLFCNNDLLVIFNVFNKIQRLLKITLILFFIVKQETMMLTCPKCMRNKCRLNHEEKILCFIKSYLKEQQQHPRIIFKSFLKKIK